MIASLVSSPRKCRLSAFLSALAIATALVLAAAPAWSKTNVTAAKKPVRERILEDYGKLPIYFVENQGQVDKRVGYYLQSPGFSLYITKDGHALRLTQGKGDGVKAHNIKIDLIDAATERIEGRGRAPGIVSYFTGSKDQWRTGIPTHTRIVYVQPWPGIDLAYSSQGGKIESIYTVAPHADPARIKLRYSGQVSLELDRDGNLIYDTSVGEMKETAPVLFQDIDGERVVVEGKYRLLDDNTVSFKIGKYDRDHTLVIDPTLVYAGYIGGNGTDAAYGIAVDSAGSAYITGITSSSSASFPVVAGPDLSFNGGFDAFVAKVNPEGTALIYAGYIGGLDTTDAGTSIAVDSNGNAYVTGHTNATEASFPIFVGPDLTSNGTDDAFVAKVNPDGTALVYAGFIGGSEYDAGFGIAVDSIGNAYVTGTTSSTQSSFPVLGGPDLSFNDAFSFDAFVAKVNPAGTALAYAGYIGGTEADEGYSIAVDSNGNAYVTGLTASTQMSFPVLVGPDLTFNGVDFGDTDAFIAKVNPAGTALSYAGFIGGLGRDRGVGIAVDGANSAYVTGRTASTETSFPVLGGPDLTFNGNTDAFVAKVNAGGTALVYAGFIGGDSADTGYGIAVDGGGNAYVSGETSSTEASFPVLIGPELTYDGGADAFVAKVNPAGTALVYAGYVGGRGADESFGIAVDSVGDAYVTGYTDPNRFGFPVVGGPSLSPNGGPSDAFVAKIGGVRDPLFSNGFE